MAVNGSATPLIRAWWRSVVEEPLDAAAVALLDDVVERLAPLALFEGFKLGIVFRRGISHDRSLDSILGSGRATIFLL